MSRILHICNDFYGTKVYSNLVNNLKEYGFQQKIFVFLRLDQIKIIKNIVDDERLLMPGIEIINHEFNGFSSEFLRFFSKTRSVLLKKIIIKTISKESYDIVHAHTWFSNGGIAYQLKKNDNSKKYIISIRNTDINRIYKYFRHQRKFGYRILKEAEFIIFVSPTYKYKILNQRYLSVNDIHEINKKSIIIPNGIDQYWIDNRTSKIRNKKKDKISLLFVGEITRNKSIHFIIRLVQKLNSFKAPVELTLIGGNKDILFNKFYFNKIMKEVNRLPYVNYLGSIKDKKILREHYAKADIFIMPSKRETFGLVYIEAMSQGTPVIYSKGQGIDGYFKDGYVGYPINPDIDEAIEKIYKILSNYDTISKHCVYEAGKFSWENITEKYSLLYDNIINSK